VIYDWDPDQKVPNGYRMVDTVNGKALGTGLALLGTGWIISVLVGSVGAAGEEEEGQLDAADGVTADDWTPLYIPIVGPFIAISTLDAKPSGMGLLIADGIVQVGGAIGIVVGFVDRKYKLVRQDVDVGGVRLRPSFSFASRAGYAGLTATGRF